MTTVKERMIEAAYATPLADSVLAADREALVQACAKVATDDNAKLLDMLKAKNEQIATLSGSLTETNKYVGKLELEKASAGTFNGDVTAEAETKREAIARSALSALLSNQSVGPYSDDKADAYARSALVCADALLRVLAVVP